MQSNSRHIQLSQYGLGGGSKPGCLDPNYHFLRLQPSIWGGCQSCWPMPGRKFLRSQALNSTPLRAQQSTWQMFSPEFLPWSVLVTSSVLQMILKSFPCSFFWRFTSNWYISFPNFLQHCKSSVSGKPCLRKRLVPGSCSLHSPPDKKNYRLKYPTKIYPLFVS